ncbi:hypothetical protein OF83DRAFT_333768 [Amylostereum chailletii]|nr:hypothetical protein OF83DRAFT_333768 [Amylostereum chailletii]
MPTREFRGWNSQTLCKVWTSISILLGVLSMASSNFIILLRVWVLWERRVALVISTLILCILCQLATLGMAIWYITQAIPHIIYMKSPNIMACALIDRINFVGLWAPGVCFEVVVFITTCWNAFDRPRAYDQGLHKALYRDGALYFVVLLALRAVNMVIAIVAPLALSILGVYFVWCTTTVTVCRFVLNLRRIAETQESTDPDGTLPCADDEILKDNPSPAFEEYEMH